MGEVKSNNDNFIFNFIVGDLELESECIFHVDPIWEVRINPDPLPWALAAPSTDNLQMERSNASWAVSVGFAKVNSMMKSAKIFPLIVVLGLYLMSNSLNSMAHFTSLPEVSGLCNICFIGCYVGILIVWSWKYG